MIQELKTNIKEQNIFRYLFVEFILGKKLSMAVEKMAWRRKTESPVAHRKALSALSENHQ